MELFNVAGTAPTTTTLQERAVWLLMFAHFVRAQGFGSEIISIQVVLHSDLPIVELCWCFGCCLLAYWSHAMFGHIYTLKIPIHTPVRYAELFMDLAKFAYFLSIVWNRVRLGAVFTSIAYSKFSETNCLQWKCGLTENIRYIRTNQHTIVIQAIKYRNSYTYICITTMYINNLYVYIVCNPPIRD